MKIGIISDLHEDIKSLKKTLMTLRKEGCHQVVCLGDVTGYDFIELGIAHADFLESRNAHEVIEMCKKNCEFILIGNHDLFSIKKLPKNKANFPYPKNWYSLDYQTRKKLSKNKLYLYEHNSLSPLLTKEDVLFIKNLPEYIIKTYDSLKILFSHYAYPDLTGHMKFDPLTSKDARPHFTFLKKHGCTLGISGHDHYEGIKIFTENAVHEIPFNKTITLTNEITWLHGPCLVGAEKSNGFLIFDTDTMKIKAVPLKSIEK